MGWSYPAGGDGNRGLGLSRTVTMMAGPASLVGLGVAKDMAADSWKGRNVGFNRLASQNVGQICL